MDGRSFDDLTRFVASGSPTRRSLVRRLVSGAGTVVLAGVVGETLTIEDAAAGGDAVCQAADPSEFVSKHACEVLSCGPLPNCLCIQTVGHVPTCVMNYDPHKQSDCPDEDECNSRRKCKNGYVCAKTEGCCGGSKRKCMRRCTA